MDAAEIIAATPAPSNKHAVLASLGALLETIELEQSELVEHQARTAGFDDQLNSLAAQRAQVTEFTAAQDRNEPISFVLLETFDFLLEDDTLTLEVRNDRLLGLFRSAAACIMVADWTDDAPITTDWVETFNRVTDRKIRDLRASSLGYAKVGMIKYLQTVQIPLDVYTMAHYDRAPKEYWLQYAGFSLVSSVLKTRKLSQQLRSEMGPAIAIINVALAKAVQVPRPAGL